MDAFLIAALSLCTACDCDRCLCSRSCVLIFRPGPVSLCVCWEGRRGGGAECRPAFDGSEVGVFADWRCVLLLTFVSSWLRRLFASCYPSVNRISANSLASPALCVLVYHAAALPQCLCAGVPVTVYLGQYPWLTVCASCFSVGRVPVGALWPGVGPVCLSVSVSEYDRSVCLFQCRSRTGVSVCFSVGV